MCVSIIALVAETISFSLILAIGENILMRCNMMSVHYSKEFIKPRAKVTSFFGLVIFLGFLFFKSGSMRQGDHFSQTKKKSEKPVIDIIDFLNKYAL